jgi:hypothetical protein
LKEESMLRQVVRDVRDLADRRGWKAVEELADRILSCQTGHPVLVVSGNGVDSTAFRQWMEQVTATTEIAATGIAEIGTRWFEAHFAEKLVAVFDCRRVLEAGDVNLIVEHVLSRPLDTIAIVFLHAERLESAEELDLMERASWRVLIPGPQRDWQHQDLSAYRCYLWNASVPGEFLRERCRHDREALAAILQHPLGDLDRESLDRERVIRLVDFAQENVAVPRAHTRGATNRPRAVENQIAGLRGKIGRRLDAEAAGLGRETTASLVKLEQSLLRSVGEPLVKDGLPRLDSSPEFRTVLERRLDQIIVSWRKELEAELNRRTREIASQMQEMLREVDWASIYGMAGAPQPPSPHGLTISAASAPALTSLAPGVREPWKAVTATAAAITALSLLSLSAAPVLIGGGILTTGILQRARKRSLQLNRSARQAIHDMIERAIPGMRAGIHWAIADYRNRLLSGLLEIETALAATSSSQETIAEPESDREQLLSFRRRV